MRHILFLSLLLLLWSAEFLFATDDNENVRWKNFHLQDINGPVYTVTTGPGGEVYIGGSFTEANGLSATNIVRWYNGTWSVLGSGLSGGSLAAVYAIAVAENGTVYAGGQFTTAGGKTVNNIARWDGSNWSALGNGTNDRVNALALGSNGAVYAGGAFTTASGISAGAVALWQNGQWNQLGMGLREGKAEVMALAVHEDELYAGGNFLQAGEISTFNIARWNGNQWLSLDSGIAPYTACVYTLAFQDDKLYAAGDFSSPFSSIAANILSWDGISWVREATFTAPVRAITFTAGGELAAAGDFTAVGVSTATTAVGYATLRTGSSWESLGMGLNGSVRSLAVLPDNSLIAGGIFDLAGPVIANHIARWNYEQWSTLGTTSSTGINGSIYAVAVAPNGDVYVGGNFTIAGTTTANSIARWNGNQWYSLGAGIEGTVNAIAIARNGTVYAGGSFTRAGGAPANAIALWDGLRWRSLNDNQAHARIYALALADDDLLYAGGLFASIGETSANCIARWSHSRWSAMSSGVNSTVYAIACRGGQVFIGGSFAFTAGSDLNGIAEWNGSRWLALAKGVEGSVSALSLDEQGQLYAGGDFTMNGSSIVRIGRWDGLRWHALGSGVNHDVSSLVTSSDGTLYTAGYFSIAGGTIASRIALWKNDRWYPLGSGLSGTPAALALSANRLYVAGVLNGAGGNPTHNFAAWQLCDFLPSVTPDGPLTLCRGTQLTLTAQKGFASYVWNTGATGPTLTVNEAGTYSVLVTDGNGCSAESSPVVVRETSATLIVASTKRTCAGSTVQLSVTGADSYHWSPTDGLSCTDCSNPTVILSSTIVYTVEGRTAEGCTSTATVKLQVHLPAEKPQITITNHTTLTSTPAFSYQWFLENKPLPGAIEQVHEASESGTYTVQTTNEEGCMALSVPVKVTLPTSDISPVSSISEPQLKLYPIPSTGSFTVEMSCPDRTALSLDIRDLFGRVVYTTFLSPSFRHTFPVELHVVPGVYLLVIRTQNTQLVREIIVQ